MSNIDKQELREAAESAASDSWGYDRDEFNDAITPEVVLALLDEMEAAEKRIAELEMRTMALRG
ncbi:TPA: ead/Ea22-like family protein [Enterobacter roggenkampii]